jgi:hypothetical protein
METSVVKHKLPEGNTNVVHGLWYFIWHKPSQCASHLGLTVSTFGFTRINSTISLLIAWSLSDFHDFSDISEYFRNDQNILWQKVSVYLWSTAEHP